MADLENFAADISAIREGAWESPGPEWGDMELKVRGFGPHYTEPQAKAQKEAVRAARFSGAIKNNQDWEDLPVSERNDVNDKMMLKHIFIDVKNLKLNGQEVTKEEFRELARVPKYRDRLIGALYECAVAVTTRREATKEHAVGNSPQSSDTTLNGHSTQTS